jgi:lauroyl/myristoyl acyltransferase
MATAAHYRKLAEECFGWAEEARDATVRQHYAKLCEIWLECADRAELRSAATSPLEPIIQKVA